MKKLTNLILILIFISALILRSYKFNWDQGFHLHPDERMITMVASDLTLKDLNPHFFAYGSFPIYLLKFTGYIFSFVNPNFGTYDQINLIGRLISALFDSLTVILIFKITKLLFNSEKKGLLAALIYSLSVFPIQLSHFYTVDTLLTFFICFTLYRSILLYQNPSFKNSLLVGIGFGFSLATKVSATVLVVSFLVSFFIETLLTLKKEIFSENISLSKKIGKYFLKILNPKFWIKNKVFKLKRVIFNFVIITLTAFITFIILEPFSVLDFSNFWQQIKAQNVMTKDAFVFPYTLQYVGTLPYLYQLKNIFLWGLGPAFGLLAFLGVIVSFIKLVKGLFTPGNEKSEAVQLIIFAFFIAYFLVVGNFAVKFMRYCLPLYPLFAVFAANFISSTKKYFAGLFLLGNLIWLYAFLNIYQFPNTRVLATNWINQNIPSDSTVLREHWDDGLPLSSNLKLNLIDLPLYESDSDPSKWSQIQKYLDAGDYLILASNRLYTPLQKLTDCSKLPVEKCYSLTAQYYQDLFSEKLGYVKVAEFNISPNIFGININDQSADESFTVYDHPKVIIFKNNHLKGEL